MKPTAVRHAIACAVFSIANFATAAEPAPSRVAVPNQDVTIDEFAIDEIIVTADLRERALRDVPASVTVFDSEAIDKLSVQHFEELIGAVPNLNWSGDGNRARYLQIRGIGELEQYEGAPDPSVGFLIDDIDFSGIGSIGTLFDIERVEVLRGPQGSRYGANALAGLVYLRSAQPTPEREGRVQLMAGGDEAWSVGAAAGGPVDESGRVRYRASAQHYRSNGFRDNPWLGRDDTNGRDETSVHGRLSVAFTPALQADFALLYVDIDDGYDAFALDNSYVVLSDKPGRDAQQSLGGSARFDWTGSNGLQLTSITSVADSDIDFSFDADWGNAESWDPVTYDYVSASARDRRTISQELRLAGDSDAVSWLGGVYFLGLDEAFESVNTGDYYDPYYDFADTLDDRLASDYDARSAAVFGQVEIPIAAASSLTGGLRLEQRRAGYDDSSGLDETTRETMVGGEIGLTHDFVDGSSAYLTLSRGYKAGGFNLGFVPDGRRAFDPEVLWNLEAGLRGSWFNDGLAGDISVFVNRRDDQQVRMSFQLDPGDPASFVFYTDNAARGTGRGLEASLAWQPAEAWQLYASIGLLDAGFEDFVTPEVDLSGRDFAHAPHYTFAAGAAFATGTGWFARVDVSGKDAFYFDVSHDERSEAYTLVNARAGFEQDAWRIELWGRNLFDTHYAVRGFYFGNEPPDFPPTLYTRGGDLRQLGVSVTWMY